MHRIPKRIHIIWLDCEQSNAQKPPLIKTCIAKALMLHPKPEWSVQVWTNEDVTIDNFPLTYNLVQQCRCLAQRADLLRLEILEKHGGGWYVDADMLFVQSLDVLYDRELPTDHKNGNCNTTKTMVVCHENDSDPCATEMMSTSVIGASANLEVLRHACIQAQQPVLNTPNINETTGPFFFGRSVWEWVQTKSGNACDTSIVRLPSSTFYPLLWDIESKHIVNLAQSGQFNSDVIAAHCWAASWKSTQQ